MKMIQHAEQLAKEIEGSSMLSGNIHMEEEREKVVEGDYDEEDLYSGVLGKTEQAQKKNEDGLTENKDATKAPNETLSPAIVVTQEQKMWRLIKITPFSEGQRTMEASHWSILR